MRASHLPWWASTLASAAVIPPPLDVRQVINVSSANTGTATPSCASRTTLTGIALNVPSSAPFGAHKVPGDFIGFGFDSAFLNDYANTFSENLVNSVASRIPGPVIIRIGGTSGDKLIVNQDQSEGTVCIGTDCPYSPGALFSVGPSYFNGFRYFPNQLMTFQAPMNPVVNASNAAAYVTMAYQALGANRLAGIALGNEPDLYSSDFGIYFTQQQYVQNALELESICQQALGLSSSDRIFQAADIAGYGNFGLNDVFGAGLNSNGLIKYASEHWYQITYSPGSADYAAEQTLLMSHDAIVGMFASTGYDGTIDYIEQSQPQAKYILSETGSSLNGSPRSFQGAFDVALWLVDFYLYSMSIGVQRIDGTQHPSANHSLWVPDTSSNNPALGSQYNPGPSVHAPYYGVPMVADFIGQTPGSVINVLADDQATAYAMYHSDTNGPTKIAIVNLVLWADNLGTARPNQTFLVPVSSSSATVLVSRLHADAGVIAQGYDVDGNTISWAGETWSYSLNNGAGSMTGEPVTEVVEVCGGYALVEVPASEAVVVYMNGAAP